LRATRARAMISSSNDAWSCRPDQAAFSPSVDEALKMERPEAAVN
jgi:hypothetical protein